MVTAWDVTTRRRLRQGKSVEVSRLAGAGIRAHYGLKIVQEGAASRILAVKIRFYTRPTNILRQIDPEGEDLTDCQITAPNSVRDVENSTTTRKSHIIELSDETVLDIPDASRRPADTRLMSSLCSAIGD